MSSSFFEFLERFKALVFETLQKIEDSPPYEQLLAKLESLEPSQQKILTLGSRLLVLLAFVYFLVTPLMTLWSSKSTLNEQRVLLSEIKSFNTSLETRPTPAPNPSDWQNMSAATPDEAHQNLRSYMTSIGLPEGSYQTIPSSGGQLQIEIPQINLRQVQTLLFQIDGWHPDLENEIVTIKTLAEDPQKLSLALTLSHKTKQPFSANPSRSSGSSRRSGGGSSGGQQRTSPSNVVQPDDEIESLSRPSFDGAALDADIRNDRPSPPRYEEYDSPDNLPDFEAYDAAGSMDSLPPPPPLEDEEF